MPNDECSLLNPQEGHCWRAACGKPLGKYRRRWCSDECGQWYARTHIWALARWEALKRDNFTCQHCGFKGAHAQYGHGMEVNHIEPRNGGGYLSGCWNHPDNLESLCHDCHVKVTNAQRQDRTNAQKLARGGGYALKLPGMD